LQDQESELTKRSKRFSRPIYSSLLTPKETQLALAKLKRFIEDGMCKELNLFRVECPLIVDTTSGVNDYLDRDGSRTPIDFHINNDYNKHPIDAQVVQAATKWKRVALKQFDVNPAKASSPICAPCVRIIFWITTTACMWISGIGNG
jgi:hypothetical protein